MNNKLTAYNTIITNSGGRANDLTSDISDLSGDWSAFIAALYLGSAFSRSFYASNANSSASSADCDTSASSALTISYLASTSYYYAESSSIIATVSFYDYSNRG